MCWASEGWWQHCFGIAFCSIQLGLDKKDTLSEVGSSEVSISEVGPGKIGDAQIGVSEVSTNEVCASQVGTPQIGSFEFGSDEVGSSVVFLVRDFGSHKFACVQQQSIDGSPMGCHVQCQECVGAVVSEAFGFL